MNSRTYGEQLSLTQWISNQPPSNFPSIGGIPYPDRLNNVTNYMNSHVHPQVEKGPLLQEDSFLTDHGPHHIETVIQRASCLLSFPEDNFPQLNPYEVYLLLLAIHFHDVGNIFGRNKHETKHADVMKQLEQHVGDEMVERRMILAIARAHGGTINGDKDTISSLQYEIPILGIKIRPQLLAAILRFSDELADDSSRAARIVQSLDLIPESSEVFHAYAKSLHSVDIQPSQNIVNLHYQFMKSDAIRTFGKGTRKVYLLDEIHDRTLKMHFERRYCMRFMQEVVHIKAITVNIEVYADERSLSPCVDPIGYRLEDRGYPDASSTKLTDICPEATIDGPTLKCQLTK